MSDTNHSQILYVNFFPRFAPPKSGGEMRYFYLTHALARDWDVAALNCTFPEAALEHIEHADGVFETRVPKPRRAVWMHRLLDRTAKFPECSGLVVAMTSRGDAAFRREFKRLASGARVIVIAAPFIYPAVRGLIRRDQYLIYDSYNVEFLLHHKTLPGELGDILNHRYIRRWERRLARDAHMIWTCSAEDAAQMERIYGADPLKMHVIPNGIDTDEIIPARGAAEQTAARAALGLPAGRPVFIFIGSLFTPNVESAEFIARRLAPAFPGVEFCIAGRAGERVRSSGSVPPNVRLMGLISDEGKARLYSAATAALNPVFSGSGTSLKILEFFAAGVPVITTPLGARGLDIAPGRHALVGEAAQFPALMREIAARAAGADAIAAAAREHVAARFSWDAIGRRAAGLVRLKTERRIIILNDFPTGDRRHGGQIHLYHMARQAARAGNVAILVPTRAQPPGRIEHAPNFEEIVCERGPWQVLADQVMGRLLKLAGDDVNIALFWRLNRRYRRLVRREAAMAGAVICSHPYLAPLARGMGLPFIYNSHNVEADLKNQMLPRGLAGNFLRRQVRRIEKLAARHSRWMTAISEPNRRQFIELYGVAPERVALLPNGVDCAAMPGERLNGRRPALKSMMGLDAARPVAIFVGSGHPPNREAVELLCERVAPALPEALFFIVGSVSWYFHSLPRPENLLLFYEVTDEEKTLLTAAADVALNPMLKGSGTNLKLLEYLAMGLPVVATPVGGRGVADMEEGLLVVAEPDGFAAALRDLLGDQSRRERLAERGRNFARENFEWDVASREFRERLAEELHTAKN